MHILNIFKTEDLYCLVYDVECTKKTPITSIVKSKIHNVCLKKVYKQILVTILINKTKV